MLVGFLVLYQKALEKLLLTCMQFVTCFRLLQLSQPRRWQFNLAVGVAGRPQQSQSHMQSMDILRVERKVLDNLSSGSNTHLNFEQPR